MNLTYRILWIEDNTDFIDSFDIDAMGAYVAEQGFEPIIEIRTTPEEISADVDGSQYDLLIIDYNIAEGDVHGSDVIRQIRDKNCLTEVIFYSQNAVSQLREVAAEKELEGVFFSGRNRDQLLGKINSVFDLTVRKVVDVENMRGIVMSGVAELDHLVTDVIRAIHDSLDAGKKVELCRKLLGKLRPTVKHLKALVKDPDHVHFGEIEKLIDVITSLDPVDFELLANDRSFDSSKRVDMAFSLCGKIDHLKSHSNGINDIKSMLLWRNALAHQRPKKVDERGFQIFEPSRGQEEVFDTARTLKLRQDLRAQRALLLNIMTLLKSSA